MKPIAFSIMIASNVLCGVAIGAPTWCPGSTGEHKDESPRYDHILVIIAENHGYEQIIGNPKAPNLNRLAETYGSATNFYSEVHPSKPNYIAILGGDTFGIHDDDAFYCRAGSTDPNCPSANQINPYVDHTVTARSLTDQLRERHLTWKGYFESIPAPGSKAIYYPDDQHPVAGRPTELYAAKHNGFIQFRAAQDDPALATKIVGFDRLYRDLARGQIPNYAHIVPNQCNDMHGRDGANVPVDCRFDNDDGRIGRADKVIGALAARIQASPIWSARRNTAIVITWDEDESPPDEKGTQGCCGFDPKSPANFGGGHIPTLVITNHGPRGLADDTPYNHYSLLRTTEDAFCIREHLGHADDAAGGVKAMTPLFRVRRAGDGPRRRHQR
jgi:phosphatidylinositol-3-phosphatase